MGPHVLLEDSSSACSLSYKTERRLPPALLSVWQRLLLMYAPVNAFPPALAAPYCQTTHVDFIASAAIACM